jgi:GTP-binding protein
VTLDYDEFLGRLVIGRVERGTLERGAQLVCVGKSSTSAPFRVTKLLGVRGLERTELERAGAGEIAILAGIDQIEIGDTVCAPDRPEALPRIHIDPPTVRVRMGINNSPFAGLEGRFLTSRQIGERLEREALGNVSIEVSPSDQPDAFDVAGRGELQLAVLIETLRREGYELSVSRPEIIVREIDGKKCEPVEDVVIEVPELYAGVVMEKLSSRQGRMVSMEHRGSGVVLEYVAPSRGLFGVRTEFLSDTRGEGVLHRTVRGYEPCTESLPGRRLGALVATEAGRTTPYSLFQIQERSTLFVKAGVDVYEGQIVGEARRPNDMNVNVTRAKKLTNIRAAGRDENTILSTPRSVTIESALEWIADDELLEATPAALRLRKRLLSRSLRKR